ncbi:MAG: heme o synthase [Bacteroidetes bacterium]|nr:heme o synthase [Bacteroidota bacterium]
MILSDDVSELRLLRPGSGPLTTFHDYWELIKPEITFQVVLAALAGFVLGMNSEFDSLLMGLTLSGTALCSAGGAVLNHYIERHNDALMRRTAQRPLPAGRIAPGIALAFGLSLIGGGLAMLWLINLITVILAAITIVLYLFAYTPLKRHTTYNTLIGTIPGALPALGGYTAVTGSLGTGGWILFGMFALWQIPHFLSLAWMYRKDYARGGLAMLPCRNQNSTATSHRILIYSILLVIVSTLPTIFEYTGWLYMAMIIPAGLWFIWPSAGFCHRQTSQQARRILLTSIAYVPVLVVALIVDHLFS